jgi:hypothetical protein
MSNIEKEKVEVLLAKPVKASFETLCRDKGISIADGLRRAIERWMKNEQVDHKSD